MCHPEEANSAGVTPIVTPFPSHSVKGPEVLLLTFLFYLLYKLNEVKFWLIQVLGLISPAFPKSHFPASDKHVY